jgi:hypothetical protein
MESAHEPTGLSLVSQAAEEEEEEEEEEEKEQD